MEQYAKNVSKEDPKDIMPETYIVDTKDCKNPQAILQHKEFKNFLKSFKKGSWWIVKPGEDANRGHGIKVFNEMHKIKEFITSGFNSGPK